MPRDHPEINKLPLSKTYIWKGDEETVLKGVDSFDQTFASLLTDAYSLSTIQGSVKSREFLRDPVLTHTYRQSK